MVNMRTASANAVDDDFIASVRRFIGIDHGRFTDEDIRLMSDAFPNPEPARVAMALLRWWRGFEAPGTSCFDCEPF